LKIDKGFSVKPLTPEARAEKQDQQLRDAAKMYEGHFLNEMVRAMRKTVGNEEGGLIKKNMAEKIFADQLDTKTVEAWTEKGGVGLADMIYTQIKEKYLGAKPGSGHQGGPMHIRGALPVGNGGGFKPPEKIQFKELPPAKTGSLEYRFHGGDQVQAPMAGKIASIKDLGGGWNSIALDHEGGLRSELTFPGQIASLQSGQSVETGLKLGLLDPATPSLAWNLDWS
jgi:flagellar protein FlgJ